ncbi:MAG: TspO/MBR family protein [Gemmobacter sp.]
MIALVLGIGTAIGTTVRPGDWYAALQKPWFTPAPWVFGPVWAVLYVLIGWAGARKLLHGGARELWLGQMALNFLWSPMFFGLQLPLAGLAVILGMLALILAFIAAEWGRDRLSAVLFLPYAAWVTLASAVNGGVAWLN